ncbi:MAG: hypothetical protein BZY85_09500 [SAR202 cluster bacterium MP-SAtl-SRR3965592-G1]|nr:MAG: hypothetical protein BZY85_09500 [SAR202 cluster bacterium MP-SAtl-SRR3965592-G1]
MYDYSRFSDADLKECGANLAALAGGTSSMEDVANKIVSYLYENITDSSGGSANALVRFYKTHPYDQLDQGLQGFAQGILGSAPSDDTNCLTMLATMGDNDDWKSRSKSNGHRAIPLASADMVAGIPMTSRLLTQFGLDVGSVIRPDPMLIGDMSAKTYNTFYVPEAVGSPYIPAQDDFVIPNGIKSVLGFGGVLSSGELFMVIMFSKASIPADVAGKFSDIGASVKEAVEPFVGNKVFA